MMRRLSKRHSSKRSSSKKLSRDASSFDGVPGEDATKVEEELSGFRSEGSTEGVEGLEHPPTHSALERKRNSYRWLGLGMEGGKALSEEEEEATKSPEGEDPFSNARTWQTQQLPRFIPFGTVKVDDPSSYQNTYTTPPSADILVRGPGYMKGQKVVDRHKKIVSPKAPYEIVGVSVFKAKKKHLDNISSKVQSLKQHLQEKAKQDDAELSKHFPQFLVICWTFKNTWHHEYTNVVHLFQRNDALVREIGTSPDGGPSPFAKAVAEFLDGSDKERSERLKFIFKVRDASSSVKKSIAVLGGEKPVLIAKKLRTEFFRGPNYLEVDQDVGSSMVASMLNSTILKTSATMIIDTSWLIEAKDESELPERLLGVVRWNYVNAGDIYVQLDENFNPVESG